MTTSNMPPVNDTLHEQSDANADLSMGYAVRTGMCNDPHSRGDKTAIELFGRGVRAMPGSLVDIAEALATIPT